MWDAFPLSKGSFLFLWRFLYRGAGLNTDASLKIKGILSNVGCSVILTLILKKHTGSLWKLLRNCLNLQDIEMCEYIKAVHTYSAWTSSRHVFIFRVCCNLTDKSGTYGTSSSLTYYLFKSSNRNWKDALQVISIRYYLKHSYKLSSNKYQKSQLSSTMVFNIQEEFFSLVINKTSSDVMTCHLHQTMSCSMYPVDKTATTTGGQPYLPQWPQQEDSQMAKWLNYHGFYYFGISKRPKLIEDQLWPLGVQEIQSSPDQSQSLS